MKTELTVEQSTYLLDLGIPKEKASGKYIVPQGKPIVSSVGVLNETAKIYPIFKLEDFLNGEILPKEIEYKYGTTNLVMSFGGSDFENEIKEWFAYYDDILETYGIHAKELIDNLYGLTCWYYKYYLKDKEDERNS